MNSPGRHHGFTLVELLVVVAVISLLLGVLLPALGGARQSARTASCLSNQRQMVIGWMMYAGAHGDRAMPLAQEIAGGGGAIRYWWGEVQPGPAGLEVHHERGFLTPYLDAAHSERGVYECAAQPWGTYRPQPMGSPAPGVPTSTYGYNGYYLCPPMTPGWSASIAHRPWRRLADVLLPSEVFVFGDALLPAGSRPMNSALLDPPLLYSGGVWTTNESPTTAFRHPVGGRSAVAARADGSARGVRVEGAWLKHPEIAVGSVGAENGPHYVPDWTRW